MPEKRRRHFLKARESRELLDKASKRLGIDLEQMFKDKVRVEAVQSESVQLFLINGTPALAQTGGNVYPTLMFREYLDSVPKVTVDMGAVPFVCKGANVMAPGIRGFEGEFQKGDLVLITDEEHQKPIALGEVVYEAEQARKVKHGVVIKNIHYVGDKIWNQLKQLGPRLNEPMNS
jgi:PUA-domain protein